MPKPRNLHWDPVAQRWESKGRDGLVKAYIDESGFGASKLTIGAGSQLDRIHKFVGTNAAVAAVGTCLVAVGTIGNATGIAVGDYVFGVPKEDRSNTEIGIVGFHIPTTACLNVWLQNSQPDSAGSFPVTGWNVIAFRAS